ncbi:hypothetical protein GJ496_004937 [Pomphorhynchus laevis]|nr:hypothetical protein GJ496_004937 [Pomphorhynchus laevis]
MSQINSFPHVQPLLQCRPNVTRFFENIYVEELPDTEWLFSSALDVAAYHDRRPDLTYIQHVPRIFGLQAFGYAEHIRLSLDYNCVCLLYQNCEWGFRYGANSLIYNLMCCYISINTLSISDVSLSLQYLARPIFGPICG